MAVKGVNGSYPFYEKPKPGGKTSGNGFGKEFMAAAGQSGEEDSKDKANGKEAVPQNQLMSTEEIMKMISNRKNEILEKVKKGETEPVIQIGAQAYTEKQWKRMLESFDDTEKDIKDRIREALEEMRKKRMEGELS